MWRKTKKQKDRQDFYIVSYKTERLTIQFYSYEEHKPGTKITVVLGQNGSGKSTVVANLLDELATMHSLINPSKENVYPRNRSHNNEAIIEYSYKGKLIRIERINSELKYFINDKESSSKQIEFPVNAFAVAHLPADKFKFSRNFQDDFYVYLGLRQATNLTTTGALEAKVLHSLLREIKNTSYRQSLDCWLTLLSLENRFAIEFEGLVKDWFEVYSSEDIYNLLNKNHQDSWGRLKISMDPRVSTYDHNKLLNFIRIFESSVNLIREKNSNRVMGRVELDSLPDLEEWEAGIEVFRRLRIVRNINLLVSKDQKYVHFNQLSSGEQQILGTITRLLERIKPGSIVVIDEPEVSLHPSWQMRYIPTLLNAISHVQDVHVIIATHSHFMVADLEESASLTVANPDSLGSFELFKSDVYGRSPENILYRVFGVGAVSNFYVEKDLTEALRIISQGDPELKKLRDIRSRLQNVSVLDNEPFAKIMNHINQYIGKFNNA